MMRDLITTWWPYAVGYGFAVLVANLLPPISRPLWKRWGRDPDAEGDDPLYDAFMGRVVGTVERPLYVAAFLANEPTFVGIWLGLKVAGGWKRWEGEFTLKSGRKVAGRSVFNIMLIGSAVSVAYAWAGARAIRLLQHQAFQAAVVVLLAVIAAHGALLGWLSLRAKKKA